QFCMFGMFGIVGVNGRSPLQWIYLHAMGCSLRPYPFVVSRASVLLAKFTIAIVPINHLAKIKEYLPSF
ncbi:MAG TPA: hypothetical protein DCE56_37895, partial [Cyanobacteria bacterium UBA8553]|nr:hypothetical protein [Cyanobacteria bacterium UBA8553]